jgi:hypothetical protein
MIDRALRAGARNRPIIRVRTRRGSRTRLLGGDSGIFCDGAAGEGAIPSGETDVLAWSEHPKTCLPGTETPPADR